MPQRDCSRIGSSDHCELAVGSHFADQCGHGRAVANFVGGVRPSWLIDVWVEEVVVFVDGDAIGASVDQSNVTGAAEIIPLVRAGDLQLTHIGGVVWL